MSEDVLTADMHCESYAVCHDPKPDFASAQAIASSSLNSSALQYFLSEAPVLEPSPRGILSDSDWDEVLQTMDTLECPPSPELKESIPCDLHEELEVTGLEFLQSPAISTHTILSNSKGGTCSSSLPSLHSLKPFGSSQFERSRNDDELSLRTRTIRHKRIGVPFLNKARRASRILNFDMEKVGDEANARSAKQLRRTHRRSGSMRRRCKPDRKSKMCRVDGCTKGARSKGLCKRHGGGKRCTFPACTRSDQGGGFCIAHGGGRRCAVSDCKNSAQSRGLCKTHGGGKRCCVDGCMKSSQEGGVCRGHGGGKLCKFIECSRNRTNRQKYCTLHLSYSPDTDI